LLYSQEQPVLLARNLFQNTNGVCIHLHEQASSACKVQALILAAS
jgi:hypothetical protein